MAGKAPVVEEEDASELKLGHEFQEARCLMISEVAVVLDAYVNRRKEEAPDEQPNAVFEKCMEWQQPQIRSPLSKGPLPAVLAHGHHLRLPFNRVPPPTGPGNPRITPLRVYPKLQVSRGSQAGWPSFPLPCYRLIMRLTGISLAVLPVLQTLQSLRESGRRALCTGAVE
eukprot:1185913-Prorocentrum_minimum.AAC.6